MVDGVIQLDAEMNTGGVKGGSKEIQSALKSLIQAVNTTDKSMRKSLSGYAEAMQQNGTATRDYAGELQKLKDSAAGVQKAINGSMAESEEFQNIKQNMQEAAAELDVYKAKREQLASENAKAIAKIDTELDKTTETIEYYTQIMQQAASKGLDTSVYQKIIDKYNAEFDNLLEKQFTLMNARDSGELFKGVDASIQHINADMQELAEVKERMLASGESHVDTKETTQLREQLGVIKEQIAAMEKAASATPEYQAQAAQALQASISAEQAELNSLQQTLDETDAKMQEMGEAAFGSADAYQDFVDRFNAAPDNMAGRIAEIKEELAALQENAGFTYEFDLESDSIDDTQERIAELEAELSELQGIAVDAMHAFGSQEQYGEWLRLVNAAGVYESEINEISAKIHQMEDAMAQVGQAGNGELGDSTTQLSQTIDDGTNAAVESANTIEESTRQVGASIQDERANLILLKQGLQEVYDEQSRLMAGGGQFAGTVNAFNKAVSALPHGLANAKEQMAELKNQITAIETEIAKDPRYLYDSGAYNEKVQEMEKLRAELERIQNLSNVAPNFFANENDYNTWLRLEERADSYRAKIQQTRDSIMEMSSPMQQFGMRVQEALASGITSIMKFGNEVKVAFVDIGQRIAEFASRKIELPEPDLKKWNSLPTVFKSTFDRIKQIVTMTIYSLQHPLQSLDRLFGLIATSVINLGRTLLSSLGHAIGSVISGAIGLIRSALQSLVNTFNSVVQGALNLSKSLAGMIGRGVLAGFRQLSSLAQGVVSALERLGESAKEAATHVVKIATNATISGFKKLGSYVLDVAKSMLHLNSNSRKSNSAFQMGFKMLLRYGLGLRSTYALIRKLRSALVDAINSLVKESPRLNYAMSLMTTSLNQLKNSIATAFEPVIVYVAPYVAKFLDLMTAAMTKIGEFFAVLTGQNSIFKAKRIWNDYAASLDKTSNSTKKASKSTKKTSKAIKDTTKAAEEAENVLAGFDELNILSDSRSKDTPDSVSGVGDALGDAAADAKKAQQDLFDEKPVDSGFAKWFKHLLGLFKKGKYKEIGKILADKINGIFKRLNRLVDWKNVGKTITKYIKGFTSIFNSLVDNLKWKLIGDTFAKGVNTILYSMRLLLTGIDWDNLGKKLGVGASAFLNGIDWEAMGEVLALRATVMLKILANAILTFDWLALGKNVANGINSFAATIIEVIDNIDFVALATRITDGLNSLVGNIEWAEIGDMFGLLMESALGFIATAALNFNWNELGSGLATSFNHALQFIHDAIVNYDWVGMVGSMTDGLNEFLLGINWDEVGSTLGDAINNAIASMFTFVDNFEWGEHGINFGTAVRKLADTLSDGDPTLGDVLKGALQGALDFMLGALTGFLKPEDKKNFEEEFNKLNTPERITLIGQLLRQVLDKALRYMLQSLISFVYPDDEKNFEKEFNDLTTPEIIGRIGKVLYDALFKALEYMLDALVGFLYPTDEDNFLEEFDKLTNQDKIDKIGDALAKMITEALKKMVTALTGWDGTDAGEKFARRLNRFFKNKDLWRSAGQAIGTAVDKLMDFATAFAKSFKAKEAGDSVRTLLEQIPWQSIATKVWTFVKTIFGKTFDFVSVLLGLDDAAETAALKAKWAAGKGNESIKQTTSLAQKLGRKLSDVFGGITTDDIKDGLANMITQVKNFIKKADEDLGITYAIGEMMKAIPWKEVFTEELFHNMWDALEPYANKLGEKLKGALKTAIDGIKKDIEEQHPVLFAAGKAAGNIGAGIGKAAKDAYTGAKWIYEQLRDAAKVLTGGNAEEANPVSQYSEDFFKTHKPIVIPVETEIDGTKDASGTVNKVQRRLHREVFTGKVQTEVDGTKDASGTVNKIQQPLNRKTLRGHVTTEVDGTKDASGTVKKIDRALDTSMTGHVITEVDGTTDATGAPKKIQGAFDRSDLTAGVDMTYDGSDTPQEAFNLFETPFKAGTTAPVGLKKDGWTSLTDFIGLVKDKIFEVPVKIVNAVGGAVNKAGNWLNSLFGGDKNKEVSATDISKPYTDAQTTINTALESIKTSVQNMKNDVSGKFATLSTSITSKVQLIKSNVTKDFLTIKTTVTTYATELQTKVSTAFTTMNTSVTSKVKLLKTTITTNFQTIKTTVTTFATTIQQSVTTQFNAMYTNVNSKVAGIKSTVTSQFSLIKTNITNQANQAKTNASNSFSTMATNIRNSLTNLKTSIGNIGWYSVGSNIVRGIYDGINGWWGWLDTTIWNLAQSLFNTACNALGIHSPSQVFADGVGKNVSLGIAEGIENAGPAAIGSINVLTDDMIKQMSRMDAIGSSVSFQTPQIALGGLLPYNIEANSANDSSAISAAIAASNDELSNVIIQAVNNATIAVVRAIETYSTTNVNIDQRSLTDVIVEEINRRTRAQGSTPLLI